MKITTRPTEPTDKVDHSRDISGLNRWSRSSRGVRLIRFILEWFTIPVEVLLRRDFGKRWFTIGNFFAGLFLLVIFAALQHMTLVLMAKWHDFMAPKGSYIRSLETIAEPTRLNRFMDVSMLFFAAAYVLFGVFHLFKIWWRNRMNTGLHSFDDGTSHLEPIAACVIWVLNLLAAPFIYLGRLFLPKKHRQAGPTPKFIDDRTAFTNTIIDPLFLCGAAYTMRGMGSVWLYISAVAVAMHAYSREKAKQNKILDFRDGAMDGKTMVYVKEKGEPLTGKRSREQKKAASVENNQTEIPVTPSYPDVHSIIEEMNRDRGHLNN